MDTLTILLLSLTCLVAPSLAQDCSSFEDSNKFDCMPDNASQQGCVSRGCCWQPVKNKTTNGNIGVPYCFYPRDFPYYEMDDPQVTDYGWQANIHRKEPFYYPGSITNLRMDVYVETENRLRFKVCFQFIGDISLYSDLYAHV